MEDHYGNRMNINVTNPDTVEIIIQQERGASRRYRRHSFLHFSEQRSIPNNQKGRKEEIEI